MADGLPHLNNVRAWLNSGGNLNDKISSKFDGTNYYNYIIVLKNNKFFDKLKIVSKKVLTNKLLINRLNYINNNKHIYGEISKLIETNNGFIVKTYGKRIV